MHNQKGCLLCVNLKRYEKKIKISNENYKETIDAHQSYIQFQEGDLVMVHLRLERFHPDTYQKLQAKKMGLFRLLKRLGENAYLLELTSDLHFSPISNVEDLFIYHAIKIRQVKNWIFNYHLLLAHVLRSSMFLMINVCLLNKVDTKNFW